MTTLTKRRLSLTTPLMHGDDVRRLQHAINERRNARGLPDITVDGRYGPDTAAAVRSTARFLGAREDTIAQGATEGIQDMILEPDERTEDQLQRARDRASAAAERGQGGQDSVRYARSLIGVKEHPAGSNTGPKLRDWQRDADMGAGPWCGAFAKHVADHAGAQMTPEIRYTPWGIAHAKAKTGGYRGWVTTPKLASPGDHVYFNFDGAPGPEHVAVLVRVLPNGDVVTIDGNSSSRGSQDNGGAVVERTRPGRLVVGVALVRWDA